MENEQLENEQPVSSTIQRPIVKKYWNDQPLLERVKESALHFQHKEHSGNY